MKIFNKSSYASVTSEPVPSPDGNSSISAGAIVKGTVDGALTFADSSQKQTLKAYQALIKQISLEEANGSKLSNPKHWSKFRRKYPDLFKDFDNSLSKTIFKWDTGVKTPNLRRHIQQSAMVRGNKYKGGLDGYIKNMTETGKIARKVKLGGNLLIAWDVAEAGNTIKNAYESGDSRQFRRAVIVEPLKVTASAGGATGGGIIGTATGSAFVMVVGIGTGGVGLAIIGVCAVVGGAAGGYFGGELGNLFGGKIDDTIEWMNQ